MTVDLTRVPLGRSGMMITRVGLGAWALAGTGYAFAWGAQDDDDAIAAIRRAVALGINWIDTAPMYGLGHSEELVGRALRDMPEDEKPFVFTKCGLVSDDKEPTLVPAQIGTEASIRREVEASLGRLGTERIDLYQMHWPPLDGTTIDQYWQTLLDLKAEGKVRAVGLSNHSVRKLATAEELGHVDSLQPPLSLINRKSTAELTAWCAAHGTGVIAYSPLQSGLLTGSFSVARADGLPTDDWRSRAADFRGEQLARNLALVEAIRPIAASLGATVGELAIAWVLSRHGVTGAIVGARRPEQVEGWVRAPEIQLDSLHLEQISVALEATGAGEGPTRQEDDSPTG